MAISKDDELVLHCEVRSLASATNKSIQDIYPEYRITSRLDELRASEYSYLYKQDHVYMDYTGAGLAADAQHRAHEERIANTLYGNPHSVNPTSDPSSQLIEIARARVLSHLKASAEEYAVIFTTNASGAARLVGESYPFTKRTRLVLTSDNHNSVNGLRVFAGNKGAKTTYIRSRAPDLRVDQDEINSVLSQQSPRDKFFPQRISRRKGLFAYPAQSNFSGVRHPLTWVSMAQAHGFDVLLDVAAFLPTGILDLSIVQPEFLIISFYKLFGYPTGVGCLVAKRSALARLHRPWFAGGTIRAVTVTVQGHEMGFDESAFEDGTLNFLSIPDIIFGLDWLSSIGFHVIALRVKCLTAWFIDRLRRLEHSNGYPMAIIYGPKNMKARGGTVTFNLIDREGKLVDERVVEAESALARISLRTGCFCNPGAAEDAFDLTVQQLRAKLRSKGAPSDALLEMKAMATGGAIRVSFGIVSNVTDVDRVCAWVEKTYRNQ